MAHLGLLSKGEVFYKTASDFKGAVIGGSEAQTRAIVKAAAGSVLVIDEAYALDPLGGGMNGGDPYCHAVIDTLVEMVHNDASADIAVILLGCASPLLSFLCA